MILHIRCSANRAMAPVALAEGSAFVDSPRRGRIIGRPTVQRVCIAADAMEWRPTDELI